MQIKIPIAEVFLSGVSIWWAIVLFTNATLLDGRLPQYMGGFSVVEEYGWAIIFLIAATVKILGLVTLNIYLRKIGLVLSMILYSIITAGYILSNQILYTGTGVYFLMLVLAWWGLREVREHDRNVK